MTTEQKPISKHHAEAAIKRGVEQWLTDHIRNTPFSQDTGAWNVLQEALSKLAPTIIKELS